MRSLPPLRQWPDAVRRRLAQRPPIGTVRFGSLRRVTPISVDFGYDRGLPIDRYYIEQFLQQHAGTIRGRVLEVGDSDYTQRFGGDAVARSDVLDISTDNPHATVVGDLTQPEQLPRDAFDCVICTQTLPYIYDVQAAVATLHRVLRAGGTVLATVPCFSRIWTKGDRLYGDYWRFTSRSCRLLFEHAFDDVAVASYGNVLSAASFLYGLAAGELKRDELDAHDPDVPLLIAVRARKQERETA